MTQPTPKTHQHVESIVHHAHDYTIQVDGTMDGASSRDPVGYGPYAQGWENNLRVRMENAGTEMVHNPWLVVNGKRQWRSVQEILAGIITPDQSEGEKARHIWEFARRHRYHFTTGDDEVKDTVKMLNVYGYTLCWDEAYTLSNLWQAAGLTIRRGVPHGHCTTEVFFDGAFHLLDSDEHLLYLLRDNHTIASEEDLARDHDLVKRGHSYGILRPEDGKRDELAAAVFVHSGPRAGGRPFLAHHRMDLDLRPGEALEWSWADHGKYHGRGHRPPRLSNGHLCFTPRLDESFARWAERAVNLTGTADGLVPVKTGREAVLVYRIASPYVCVGATLKGTEGWEAELSFDATTWIRVNGVDLDPLFPPSGPARYVYLLRLRATDARLPGFSVTTDLQMAPLSLPALEVGRNEVRYLDATQGARQVRVTHTWMERSDLHPPQAPSLPRHPDPGAALDPARLTFVWEPVAGATDYELRVSEYRDMRYTVSPVFEKLLSRTPSAGTSQWRIPRRGLLNPSQSYYWQVRARNAAGLFGPWGPVWRFTVEGPGRPLDLRLDADYERRTMVLHWTPAKAGTPAAHYQVYGSDERGFTPHRSAYLRQAGSTQDETRCPPNLLATTTSTSLTVVGPALSPQNGNHAFFRVVAVDDLGHRSGESDYAAAPRPFIFTLPPLQAAVDQEWRYTVEALRSEGDLRCISEGPQRYHSAFRDEDVLEFLLDEGPDFLDLDARSGTLVARPGLQHLGFHTVTVRVANGSGGEDVQGFDLEVIP